MVTNFTYYDWLLTSWRTPITTVDHLDSMMPGSRKVDRQRLENQGRHRTESANKFLAYEMFCTLTRLVISPKAVTSGLFQRRIMRVTVYNTAYKIARVPATMLPMPGRNTFRRKQRIPMFLLMEGTVWFLHNHARVRFS